MRCTDPFLEPFGATWPIWGPIVTSGRPLTPLDAGSLMATTFSKVLAESGGEESLKILQKDANWNQKGYQKVTKSKPNGDQNASTNQDRKKVSA